MDYPKDSEMIELFECQKSLMNKYACCFVK